MGPSIWQLLIVLLIVLLLFGTKRLRTLGSDLGSAIRGFREALSGEGEGREKPDEEALPPESSKKTVSSAQTAQEQGTPKREEL